MVCQKMSALAKKLASFFSFQNPTARQTTMTMVRIAGDCLMVIVYAVVAERLK
jgi:hypothetical protein